MAEGYAGWENKVRPRIFWGYPPCPKTFGADIPPPRDRRGVELGCAIYVLSIPLFHNNKKPPIGLLSEAFKIKMVAGIGLEPMTKGL